MLNNYFTLRLEIWDPTCLEYAVLGPFISIAQMLSSLLIAHCSLLTC